MNTHPPLQAGLARRDITVLDPSMALLGWGVPTQRPERVEAPLHARALIVREGGAGAVFAMVVVDLCFVSGAIRDGVETALREHYAALGLHGRTMIVATHTHAGPNGISDHLYFALSAPGVSPSTKRIVIDGIVAALVAAHAALAPAVLGLGRGEVPLSDAAAFNRSWLAYSSNPEVEAVGAERRDEAVDRTVRVLSIRHPESQVLRGVVSWFPLHGTSIHGDSRYVHPDHKGLAAGDLERQLQTGDPDVVALFAQEAAGDVTPNYRYCRRRRLVVGRHADDRDSAQHAADAQRRAVLQALAGPTVPVSGPVKVHTEWLDLADAPVDPRFVRGREHVRTRSAVVGLAMAEGTAEGPGPLAAWAPLRGTVARGLRLAGKPATLPFIELGRGRKGRLFGVASVRSPALALLVGNVVAPFLAAELARSKASFVPQWVPLRLARIGGLALIGMPCEPTTVAGRRLRGTVEAAFAAEGVALDATVVAAYADEYVGYTTTPEEYVHQHYEAACTFFGPHTLDAYRTAHAGLVRAMEAS